MRKSLAAFIVIVQCFLWAASAGAVDWQYPAIKNYGPVVAIPNAAVPPEKSLQYKILCNVTSSSKEPSQVNPGLGHVARTLNAFAIGGMKPSDIDIVVIIHGSATRSVLKDADYKNKYGVSNPNTELIRELKNAGVKLFVCGDALGDNSFQPDWVNPDITIALSSLVFIPTYELKGYAFMPL